MNNLSSFGTSELSINEVIEVNGGAITPGGSLFRSSIGLGSGLREGFIVGIKFIAAVLAGVPDGIDEGLKDGR